MIIAIAMGFILPALAGLFCRVKFGSKLRTFLVGCVAYFCFGDLIITLVGNLLALTPVGDIISSNIIATAIYSGVMTGIMVELGRFLAIKYFLKEELSDNRNAIMFGAGAGGFETFYTLVSGMVSYLAISLNVNKNGIDSILSLYDESEKAEMRTIIEEMAGASWSMYIGPVVGGIAAILLSIALSIFMWLAVKKGQIAFAVIAALLHIVFATMTLMLSIMSDNIWAVEIVSIVLAVFYLYIAFLVYRNDKKEQRRI